MTILLIFIVLGILLMVIMLTSHEEPVQGEWIPSIILITALLGASLFYL